jgi:hypothetical protein
MTCRRKVTNPCARANNGLFLANDNKPQTDN